MTMPRTDGTYDIHGGKSPKIWIEIERQKCSRFFCQGLGDNVCCVDCPEDSKRTCKYPCLNHPSRCGLAVENKNE